MFKYIFTAMVIWACIVFGANAHWDSNDDNVEKTLEGEEGKGHQHIHDWGNSPGIHHTHGEGIGDDDNPHDDGEDTTHGEYNWDLSMSNIFTHNGIHYQVLDTDHEKMKKNQHATYFHDHDSGRYAATHDSSNNRLYKAITIPHHTAGHKPDEKHAYRHYHKVREVPKANKLEYVSGNQRLHLGDSFTRLAVKVLDQYDNPFESATVTFTMPDGTTVESTSESNGEAKVDINPKPSSTGTHTAKASLTDLIDIVFTIEIANPLQFAFEVANLEYPVGVAITPYTFPTASWGFPPITYSLNNTPSGLTFDPSSRTLSGTPDTVKSRSKYVYSATDSIKKKKDLPFYITISKVSEPPQWTDADNSITLNTIRNSNKTNDQGFTADGTVNVEVQGAPSWVSAAKQSSNTVRIRWNVPTTYEGSSTSFTVTIKDNYGSDDLSVTLNYSNYIKPENPGGEGPRDETPPKPTDPDGGGPRDETPPKPTDPEIPVKPEWNRNKRTVSAARGNRQTINEDFISEGRVGVSLIDSPDWVSAFLLDANTVRISWKIPTTYVGSGTTFTVQIGDNYGSDDLSITLNYPNYVAPDPVDPPIDPPDPITPPVDPVDPPIDTPVVPRPVGPQTLPQDPDTAFKKGDLFFSELMFESKGGNNSLPQWIEVYNDSNKEVDIKGWKLTIEWSKDNPVRLFGWGEERIISRVFTIKESFIILPKTTALLVTDVGRKSNKINELGYYNLAVKHRSQFFTDNRTKNRLFNKSGFRFSLTLPNDTIIDAIGNVKDGEVIWDLPNCRLEHSRTSIMRRYRKGRPTNGTEELSWVKAIDVKQRIIDKGHYYGHPRDIGTPYHVSKGALPVTLSYFNPQVKDSSIVIQWATSSEVDNAGFNIYRSLNSTGKFVKLNKQLISGAGTTSDRNEYVFTDNTIMPNTEYYYRIEDVSFDGIRQVVATQRVKGILSAQNKLVIKWANIKTD